MKRFSSAGSLVFLSLLTACTEHASLQKDVPIEAQKPSFAIDKLNLHSTDGITDDLVSAGLNLAQLRSSAPQPLDPLNPTVDELRRLAYHQNFQSLLALSEIDGYGQLYSKAMAETDSAVAGVEYTLPVRYSDHSVAAMLMVQVPDRFDPKQPCLIVTASSGSRGIYGAAGVVGAWGLHKGCAVASTDKGTGTGFYWLDENVAQTTNGEIKSASEPDSHFWVKNNAALEDYKISHPHRVATKHAHSTKAIEADWGQFVVQASQLGFYVLNEFYRDKKQTHYFTRANTLSLGAAISNGGAAIIRAGELDTEGWLDGIVVSEPNIFLANNFSFTLNGENKQTQSLPERAVNYALYGPCASLSEEIPSPLRDAQLPYFSNHFATRCQQLKSTGFIDGETLSEQSSAALAKMIDAGLTKEGLPLVMTSSAIGLWESIVVNYGNSYLRSSADAPLCNVSYAFTDQSGKPIATPSPVIKTLFGASSGIVPTGGLQLINDLAKDGAASFYFSKNDQGLFDYGFDNLLCFSKTFSTAPFQTQVNALAFSGNLHKTPTLIVQGGADNLIQPSQHSRPYLALNYQKEGGESNVRYIEVSHAQHFDSFLNYPAMRSYYIPLHYYFEQALDAMFNHLNTGAPLPPSQLIHTQPNIDITQALIKLPSIAADDETLKNTAGHNRIRVDQDGVTIPSN